ncbi:hypothetical protein [Actinoplanes sp. N902-109]|uniref:hypothetical protein n=1 Tax=Actinoplanes sp. (strain N902-109) TaxID=649831 RepID=UPI00032938EF|nr:hypothetical protein [Actinoplanes sp. N902-109]AGL17643.1 hypothetical protein L083_4133 [Actinoplanes sp. N902-109]
MIEKAGHIGGTDEELLGELRRLAVALDGVPEAVLAAARGVFAGYDRHCVLATLVAGRAAPDGAVTGDPWTVSFAGGGIEVDVEVSDFAGQVRLCGRFAGLAPAGAADVCVETVRGRRAVRVDRLGRFVVDDVRHGPVRLRCRSSRGPVTTAWVTV